MNNFYIKPDDISSDELKITKKINYHILNGDLIRHARLAGGTSVAVTVVGVGVAELRAAVEHVIMAWATTS